LNTNLDFTNVGGLSLTSSNVNTTSVDETCLFGAPGKLDREIQSSYNFTVRVTDKGNPVLYSTADVTVHVYDDNDNPPVIHMPNSFNDTFYIPYTAMPGTVIMKVNATDSDLGQNAQLLFYIDNVSPSNKNIFKLDANTGFLRIVMILLILFHFDLN
jgi:hypothetical protein